MSAKERVSRFAGMGNNVEIKKRDPTRVLSTSPARLMEFSSAAIELHDRIEILEKQVSEAGSGGAKMFPLSRIHKVPGRQRRLSEEERRDLLENLRSNPLDTPITLVKRDDGDWNIVSGNNRVDMFRELGRVEIEGIEKDYDENVSDKQAFFSNLLHPSLTDFEKYLGFKLLIEKFNLTQDEVAADSGINKSVVSRLMSFSKLPNECLELLRNNPEKIGARSASELAILVEEGRVDQVLEAVKSIVLNEANQASAIATAKKDPATKEKTQTQTYTIKSGKKKFAEMRGASSTIRIEFMDEEQRKKFEELIYKLIQQHATE